MSQVEAKFGTYKYINPDELIGVLHGDPLWYQKGPASELIDQLIDNPQIEHDQEVQRKKAEFLGVVEYSLRQRLVYLGDRPEGFNDDDRWGGVFNPTPDSRKPDTVIIHHTATSGTSSFDHIDALGLLRIYVPEQRRGTFGKDLPISSGHYLGGRQVFVGYHDIIWPNGLVKHALRPNYTGLHADFYPTNCRSYGVAFVGDFREGRRPTPQALLTGRRIALSYGVSEIIGHQDVIRKDGKKVNTECPGNTYHGENGWRNDLVRVL